jgi:hypothetical protein
MFAAAAAHAFAKIIVAATSVTHAEHAMCSRFMFFTVSSKNLVCP